MVLFNYSTRELTAKIVYYGPGLCGKTTNLQYIFDKLPSTVKGKMLSLATKTDRTLFFDFLPLDLGEIRGMKTRIQLYTVPGQVFYNETRRLVLKGADGVVFVADSQKQMKEANVDSYRNLEENLRVHSIKMAEMPLVVQYNKRDLPNLASIEELNGSINRYSSPFYESVATSGLGVQDTLKAITKLVLLHLTRRYDAKRPAVELVGSSVAMGSSSAAGDHPSVLPPSLAAYAAPRTAQASVSAGVRSSATASATATAFDETTETEEEVLELTEDDEQIQASAALEGEENLDEVEPIELVEEMEEPARSIRASASAAVVEQEFEIDDASEAAEGSVESSDESPDLAHGARRRPYRAATPVPLGEAAGRVRGKVSVEKDVTEEPTSFDGDSVPRLVVGQERMIQVPIDIEMNGTTKRFTLSIGIRLSDSRRTS